MSDTKTKVKGYKGHRAGTKAEKAHRLVDENPKAEAADLTAKIEKLGIAKSTAGHWVSIFRKKNGQPPKAAAGKNPASKKPEKSKPAATTKKAPVRPAAKTAPVIKKPEPAAPAATTTA